MTVVVTENVIMTIKIMDKDCVKKREKDRWGKLLLEEFPLLETKETLKKVVHVLLGT